MGNSTLQKDYIERLRSAQRIIELSKKLNRPLMERISDSALRGYCRWKKIEKSHPINRASIRELFNAGFDKYQLKEQFGIKL